MIRSVATHVVLTGLLTVLLTAACSDSDPSSGAPIRTDSAGVALVVNAPSERALDWTFERILTLGGEDEGPTAFFRVFPTSIGVDSLRNLYVLDAGNFTVAVFDPSGRHLHSFGRQGEGPGELGFPSDMAVSPAGASAVYDFVRRALVRFDAAGSHTGILPLPGALQRQVSLLADGRVVAAVSEETAADTTDFVLLSVGDDTSDIARLRRFSRHPPRQFSCGSVAMPPYFGPRVVWAAAGNRVVFSDDRAYSVRVIEEGRLSGIWRRELPKVRSTLDLAAWEVARGDSLRFPGCVAPAQQAAREFGYADIAPTIEGLAVAPDGGIWIRRRTDVPGHHPIDVIDATGAYVGTLPVDSPFPALFRAPDEIVTVERDELGRLLVVVYRVGGTS